MNKISDWIEYKLLPPLAKLAEQKHLRAIRDGIIATMPLIIVGSLFTLIVNFPIPAWTNLIEPYNGIIMLPYRITVGLMSLFAAYGMGNSLAKSYNLDGVSGGTLSLGTFLMTMTPAMGGFRRNWRIFRLGSAYGIFRRKWYVWSNFGNDYRC